MNSRCRKAELISSHGLQPRAGNAWGKERPDCEEGEVVVAEDEGGDQGAEDKGKSNQRIVDKEGKNVNTLTQSMEQKRAPRIVGWAATHSQLRAARRPSP